MILVWCCLLSCISVFVYSVRSCCCTSCWCFDAPDRRFNIRHREEDGGSAVQPPSEDNTLAAFIPCIKFRAIEVGVGPNEGDDSSSGRCSICLSEIAEDPVARVKQLACLHYFHSDCIDEWLRVSTMCPLCRQRAARRAGGSGSGGRSGGRAAAEAAAGGRAGRQVGGRRRQPRLSKKTSPRKPLCCARAVANPGTNRACLSCARTTLPRGRALASTVGAPGTRPGFAPVHQVSKKARVNIEAR